MRLNISYASNCGPNHIDEIIIMTANGVRFPLDRERTETIYNKQTDVYHSEWQNLYIWDGNNEILLPNDLQPKGWSIENIVIDDEAPIDAKYTILGAFINGVDIQVNMK